ncbi:hypothetical protein [Micromonospora cathayae]|uniref:4Fe-4S ferredoxin-type domain-containing protein n=1 Tax=Micromonospora cathayae TaxID=3028804 RepID=A0ABY7ZXV1_9ACTN|nr:hypothetical protein [Micromonospora sp. HUAS 3]WDZ87221.1 hypothetical protein PVK37_12835 [Micromonospora sp. HUAS 3]
MTIHLHITPTTTATRPGCCICDPATCLADDSGDHCIERSCGVCLHGCPAPVDEPCCLDGDGQ